MLAPQPADGTLLALRRPEVQARAKDVELDAILDATPAALWIAYDRECSQVRASRAGYEVLRASPAGSVRAPHAPPVTWPFRMLREGVEIPPEEMPLQRAARECVDVRAFDAELHFDDGAIVHLVGNAVPLRDGDGRSRGAIATFVDVTPMKRAEAALREADRRKDEFLAILSHEMRNPLAPILMAVQLLRRRDAAPGSRPQRELEVIERQSRHLMRLVDDLLDVSRIAQGKVELRRQLMELSRVVSRSVEVATPAFEQKRQHLEVDVPASGLLVDADEVRLGQVVSNLLTNASRYTPEGGHVRVSAALDEGNVVLRVRDDGIGISRELLPHVFEMFVQGEQRAPRRQGGLGLGLALVKNLTAMHGGQVEARSEGPGKGAELVVRLPSQGGVPSTDRPSERDATSAGARAGRRVLLVDDHVDAAEMVADLLADAGHDVRVAHDAETALDQLAAFDPDVALLDLGLPVIDGFALAAEVRRLLGPAAPTLVALTGYGQEEDRRRTVDAGFAFHVVKPIEPTKLLELVAGIARRAPGAATPAPDAAR